MNARNLPTFGSVKWRKIVVALADLVANWPPIYIGKESDKRWEEGEDVSLLEFKTTEYKRKGYAIAADEQLARIAKVSKREFMRRGVNQRTLEKICDRQPVSAATFARTNTVRKLVTLSLSFV
jgi:hypothetical protein